MRDRDGVRATGDINRLQVQVEKKEEEIKCKGRLFSPDFSSVKKIPFIVSWKKV